MERVFQGAQLSTDPAAQSVVNHLREQEESLELRDAILYYDFPLFRDSEDNLYRSYLLLASPRHGIILLQVSGTGPRAPDVEELHRKDDDIVQLHSIIFGMLLKSRILRSGLQQIRPNLVGLLFVPNVEGPEVLSDLRLSSEPVCSFGALDMAVRQARQDQPLDADEWSELRAIIEGAKGLIRPRERTVPEDDPGAPAAVLAELESEIKTFDLDQRNAAMSIVDGPQRIRGLAGSGKTVVLAYKAAQLHLSDPDADILFTFYTKSLYDFAKRLITRFYRQYVDHDPNWERIHILHAWGGRNIEGVYYRAALDANVQPIDFGQARRAGAKQPFDYVCRQLLDTERVTPKYDYVLIDEAQDFPSAFYRLCFELTRGGPLDRSVVWAYDELQNIFDVQIQSPREAFGTTREGEPVIDLDRASEASGRYGIHDIVLHRCYRNPREVLLTAHALGFGIYSETIVQTLQGAEHWEDVGYEIVEGDCTPGTEVVIHRPRENSPLSISERVTAEELVVTASFGDVDEEVAWIRDGIAEFLAGGLRPDDIMVICLDDRSARTYFERLAQALGEDGVDVNNVLDSPYSDKVFIIDGAVTLSTVYRAKGNEAAVVYAAGVDAIYPMRKSRLGRNRLFTAFTRAKAWLRVSGTGEAADFFRREIRKAVDYAPDLRFVYPDPREVEMLQRDLSDRFVELEKFIRRMEQLDMLEEAEEFLKMRGLRKG